MRVVGRHSFEHVMLPVLAGHLARLTDVAATKDQRSTRQRHANPSKHTARAQRPATHLFPTNSVQSRHLAGPTRMGFTPHSLHASEMVRSGTNAAGTRRKSGTSSASTSAGSTASKYQTTVSDR